MRLAAVFNTIVSVLACVALNPVLAETRFEEGQKLLDEIYQSEHSLIHPGMDLLFVTFIQDFGADIFLEKLELRLDNRLVVEHVYTWEDVAKLMEQAVQQLYTNLISPGEHTLYARLYGRGMIGRDYLEGESTITKGGNPTYVEISIVANKLHFEVWQ